MWTENSGTHKRVLVTRPNKRRGWFGVKQIFSIIQSHQEQEDREVVPTNGPMLPMSVRPAVIATMNQKGGCGKTTTVVNLAAAIALKGYRTLVIDMDPQAHASLGLGVKTEDFHKTMYHFLLDANVAFDRVVRETCVARLHVLPSTMRLSAAQTELANMTRGESALKSVLRRSEKNYDFILIDCPPTLSLLTLNALVYAKKVLVPVQTHYYPLEGMKELFRTITAVRKRFNPQLEVLGILATLFDKRVSIATEMLMALQDHFRSQMLRTVINNNVKLIEAPMARESVVTYAPSSSAAYEFNELANEVIDLIKRNA